MRGMARTAVIAGTATAVSGRVARRQQGRWAAQEQAQQAQAPIPEPAPQEPAPQVSGGMDDKLAQLKQLGDLQAAGVLTPEEFAAQKAQILNS
jgi:hypothetical protein